MFDGLAIDVLILGVTLAGKLKQSLADGSTWNGETLDRKEPLQGYQTSRASRDEPKDAAVTYCPW